MEHTNFACKNRSFFLRAVAFGCIALLTDYLLGIGVMPLTIGYLLSADFVIPTKYVMPEGANESVRIWREGTDQQRVRNMLYVKKQFIAKATLWGIDPDMVTIVTYWADRMETLYKAAKGVRASTADRARRNMEMVQALYYFRHNVHQFCEEAVSDPNNNMQLVDMNLMGFLFSGQNKGGHKKNPLPTEVLTLKVLPQNVPGQLRLIFERNPEGHSEEGKKHAKPQGSAGIVVAYKLVSESNTAWRYAFYTKVHELLVLPEEWHGEAIHIKAAYYAHVTDDKNKLPWCNAHTVFIIKSSSDAAAQQAAELKAKDEALAKAAAELAELKAQLAAKK